MLLSPTEAKEFFGLQWALYFYVNQRYRYAPRIHEPDAFQFADHVTLRTFADHVASHLDEIDTFVDLNPGNLSDDDLETVRSWKGMFPGEFVLTDVHPDYAGVLSLSYPPVKFGVLGLTMPLAVMMESCGRSIFKTRLLPFHDKIVFDGTLLIHPVPEDPELIGGVEVLYHHAISTFGLIERSPFPKIERRILSLDDLPSAPPPELPGRRFTRRRDLRRRRPTSHHRPPEATPALPRSSHRAAPARPAKATDTKRVPHPKDMPSVARSPLVNAQLAEILSHVDACCRKALNEEYQEVCHRLAQALADLPNSPIAKGNAEGWAAGVVRVAGMLNGLANAENTPHLPLRDVDRLCQVSLATGNAKAKAIREALRIEAPQEKWTIASRRVDPLVWMLELDNGRPFDIRRAPITMQRAALAKGLIPFLPTQPLPPLAPQREPKAGPDDQPAAGRGSQRKRPR